MISPLFTTIVVGSAFIWIYMKVTTKNAGFNAEAFLEREREANNVRKQPLTDLEYVELNYDNLPVQAPAPNEMIAELQDRLSNMCNLKCVNLTGITNTDLKFKYGVANLALLTEYDQNFTNLSRTIYELGHEYAAIGDTDRAISFFELGIRIKTDISNNFIELAKLYKETSQIGKINSLIASAENIRSLTKNSTIEKLNDILIDVRSNVNLEDIQTMFSSSDS